MSFLLSSLLRLYMLDVMLIHLTLVGYSFEDVTNALRGKPIRYKIAGQNMS